VNDSDERGWFLQSAVRIEKCYLTYLLVVFPIRGKILKPGFRVAEKRNLGKSFFFGFWNEWDFER